jgi:hypothetical protein
MRHSVSPAAVPGKKPAGVSGGPFIVAEIRLVVKNARCLMKNVTEKSRRPGADKDRRT